MTARNKNTRNYEPLLERIRDTVESIDRNVQEILEHVSEHFEDARYRTTWQERSIHDDEYL